MFLRRQKNAAKIKINFFEKEEYMFADVVLVIVGFRLYDLFFVRCF